MSFNPAEIMHMSELENWLEPYARLSGQTPDGVMQDVIDIWKQEGQLLNSEQLAQSLADKYLSEKGLTDGAKEKILADIADIEALKREADGTTGVLTKDHKGVETALSHVYAKATDTPVMMLEFDFGNMGGTNELFHKKFAIEALQEDKGYASFKEAEAAYEALDPDSQKTYLSTVHEKVTHAKTDMAAKIVTQSVLTDLKAHFPDSEVMAIRTGGDELRFMVEGVDPSKYQDVIMATTHNVEIKMAELDLLDHEHAKGRDNRFKDGFGGGLAAEDMRNIDDPDNIIARMDEDVKDHKNSIGEMRQSRYMNVVETVQKNMSDVERARIDSLPPEEKQQALNDAVAKQEEHLRRNAANIRAHAPNPTQTIAEYDARAAQILADVDQTPEMDVNDTTLKTADAEGLEYDRFATIEERRVAYMEQRRVPEYETANGGQAIDQSVKDFMEHEARSLNPMDPSADVNTIADFKENAQIWHDATTPEARPHSMFIGFQNLGGLNNLLGHDGADAVLKDMSSIVKTSLVEAGVEPDKFVMVHNGGGEFRIVVQPGHAAQIEAAQNTIAERTADLNSQNISEYLETKKINVDPETQEKIQGKDFATVEDPKVRETNIGDTVLKSRVDGLEVISVSGLIEIYPEGNSDQIWSVERLLTHRKDGLDRATEEFRHERILDFHNIDENNPPRPDMVYDEKGSRPAPTPEVQAEQKGPTPEQVGKANNDGTTPIETVPPDNATPTDTNTPSDQTAPEPQVPSEPTQAEPTPTDNTNPDVQENTPEAPQQQAEAPVSDANPTDNDKSLTDKFGEAVDKEADAPTPEISTPEEPAKQTPTDGQTPDTTNGSTPDADIGNTRLQSYAQGGGSAAGIAMGAMGFQNAYERGDGMGMVISATDVAVSSGDLVLDMGQGFSDAAKGVAMKANIGITIADGIYQISQEEELDHQVARGAAVVTTTAAAFGTGALVTAGTGVVATVATVAAPITVAVAVGITTDAAVDAYKAQSSFEDSIANTEQGSESTNKLEESGAPSIQSYSNLRAFAIVEGDSPTGEDGLNRQEIAKQVLGHEYSQDPAALDKLEEELKAKVEHYDQIIEENDSWVPDFTRIFGQDEVQEKMSAQVSRAPYVAALNELEKYRQDIAEYNQQPENTAEARTGLSGNFDEALANDDPDKVAASVQNDRQTIEYVSEDLNLGDLNRNNSLVSMNGENQTPETQDNDKNTITTKAQSNMDNIAP